MGRMINLIGQKFGRWTVIEPAIRPDGIKNTCRYWLCRCDCGTERVVNGAKLRNGKSLSCGCLRNEKVTKHGMRKTRLYNTFQNMKNRCYVPNRADYSRYGGRGITICPEWLDKENGFTNFYNWAMSHGYSEELSIDRRDVDGNYEPSNCRWADDSLQVFNRRPRSNKTGHTGVFKKSNGKYIAQISKNNKKHNLGTFSTLEEAVEARERAESELYPEGVKKNKNNKVR